MFNKFEMLIAKTLSFARGSATTIAILAVLSLYSSLSEKDNKSNENETEN